MRDQSDHPLFRNRGSCPEPRGPAILRASTLRPLIISMMLMSGLVHLSGCKSQMAPDYARPLPSGTSAMRKLPPDQWPSFTAAWKGADHGLLVALESSLSWFDKPSTRQFFPIEGISHEQARLSVGSLIELLNNAESAVAFESRLHEEFDIYTSVGWDGHGTVFFTGYFSPVFAASQHREGDYQFPLYRRPDDLVGDPVTGEILGRRVGQTHIRYPRRARIEAGPKSLGLAGHELVFLSSRLDAYLIHVNGSARLTLPDSSIMHVGYAGSNGRPYTSVGRLLVREGKIGENELSLKRLRSYFAEHPEQEEYYFNQNDRYVFFQTYEGDRWPAGSLGLKVTPWRSLATDKSIFPRGCPVLVVTQTAATTKEGTDPTPFESMMVDQDTGGAIRAAGRADIFMGIGPAAEVHAGNQSAEGRLFYIILRADRIDAWRRVLPSRHTAAADT